MEYSVAGMLLVVKTAKTVMAEVKTGTVVVTIEIEMTVLTVGIR